MKKLCLALLCVGIGGALLFVLLKNGNPTPVVPQYEETSQPPRDFLCEIPEGKLALSISIQFIAGSASAPNIKQKIRTASRHLSLRAASMRKWRKVL